MTRGQLLTLALALVLAAVAHGGLYTIVTAGAGSNESSGVVAYRLNRWTGTMLICHTQPLCFEARVIPLSSKSHPARDIR